MTPHRQPIANRRGFTLMELMIVLTLIAILSALILPEMRGTLEESLLRAGARQLVDACGIAYSRAVSAGQTHRLELDPKTGKYRVERLGALEGSGARPEAYLAGAEGVVDRRIAVELRTLEGSESALANGVHFYSDGTAQAAEFVLQDRQGFRLRIKVNPITSRAQVSEVPIP